MATYGPYAGTNFALKAAIDSLRRALAPHGVQVVIEPGAVDTEIADRSAANDLAEKEFEQWRYSFAVMYQQRRQGADNDEHR